MLYDFEMPEEQQCFIRSKLFRMKDYFLLTESTLVSDRSAYDINASHQCGLPGVRCEQCNCVWSTTGIDYPTVDSDRLQSLKRFFGSAPVSIGTFREIISIANASISQGITILPGTEFGPLIGHIKGVWERVVWQNPWTLLVENRCFDLLNSRGLDLIGRQAELTYEAGVRPPRLIELEVHIGADLHRSAMPSPPPEPCVLCGRLAVSKPDRIVIDKHSLRDAAIQRIRSFPTHFVASEDFVRASRDLGLDEIAFSEVSVE